MPLSWSVRALGTTAISSVVEPGALDEARAIMLRELRALDLACSRFRVDSELQAVNANAGRPTRVGQLLWTTLRAAVEVAEMTGGCVDPTVGRAMRGIGYDRTFTKLAQHDAVSAPAIAQAGRWREIVFDPIRRTVCLPAGVELDLGASAKALGADLIVQRIAGETGVGALVSLGGDISVAGPPPEGGWVIGVHHDHATSADAVAARVVISSGGLASSSTRIRRWTSAGGEMHHIVDPQTGLPALTPWATVTVAAASCLEANAASTAAIVLGARAPAWLDKRRLPSRLARRDGRVTLVAGWPEATRAAA